MLAITNSVSKLAPKQRFSARLLVQARHINMDKLTNKRITRIEADTEIDDKNYSNNLINRNPRNLEQLSLEKKPEGFWLEKSPPATWNKLVFEQSGRYLNTYLLHWSGKKLIESSTSEPKLSKYFKNPNTSQAAITLAQVMSRRCLQSGYLSVGVDDFTTDDTTGIKTKLFFEPIQSGGLVLEEMPEIKPRNLGDL